MKQASFQTSTYSHALQTSIQGSSGLKVFDGEDLTAGDRRRLQQLQSEMWWKQQEEEKQRKNKQLEMEKEAFDQQTLQIRQYRENLEQEKEHRLREMEIAAKTTNAQQLEDKLNKEALERSLDQEERLNHIAYLQNHDLFTENTDTCQSALGKNRVLPYHWKGMNEEQRNRILEEQERQRQEKILQKVLEKEEDKLFAEQMEAQRMAIVLQDRAKNKGLTNQRKGMDEYNRLKAEEMKKKAFNAFKGTQTYKNEG